MTAVLQKISPPLSSSLKPHFQSSQKLVRSELRTSFCDDWKRGFIPTSCLLWSHLKDVLLFLFPLDWNDVDTFAFEFDTSFCPLLKAASVLKLSAERADLFWLSRSQSSFFFWNVSRLSHVVSLPETATSFSRILGSDDLRECLKPTVSADGVFSGRWIVSPDSESNQAMTTSFYFLC